MSPLSPARARPVALAQEHRDGIRVHQRSLGASHKGQRSRALVLPQSSCEPPGAKSSAPKPEPTPSSSLSHRGIPSQPSPGTRRGNDSPNPVPAVLLAGSNHHCSPQEGTFLLPRTWHSFGTAAELWPKCRGGAGLSWGLQGCRQVPPQQGWLGTEQGCTCCPGTLLVALFGDCRDIPGRFGVPLKLVAEL